MLPFLPALITGGIDLIGDMVSQGNARSAFKHRYQDTVADQRAAGLNPALAYGQGGGNPQTADFGDIGSAAAGGARDYASAKQMAAQTNLTQTQADLLKAQKDDLIRQTRLRTQGAEYGPEIQMYRHMSTKARALIDVIRETQAEQTNASDVEGRKARNQLDKHRAEFMKLSLPEQRAIADYFNSAYGRKERYMQSARDWSSTATDWIKAFRGGNTTNVYRR